MFFKKTVIILLGAFLFLNFSAVAVQGDGGISEGLKATAGKANFDTTKNNNTTTIYFWVAKIIAKALEIMGMIALIMIIYAGFTILISAGKSEKVQTGQKILVYSIIGLVIIFGAYMINDFVLKTLVTGTMGQ